MNFKITTAAVILSTVSLSALADANHTYPTAATPASTVAQASPAAGKTRAEVYQELIEARRQGLIPTPEYDYPPSQHTIDNNKARNQIVERYWASQGGPQQQ